MSFELSENAASELRDIKRRLDILWNAKGETPPPIIIMRNHLAQIDGTAITASTTTTPGSGTVTLLTLDDSGDYTDVLDASDTAVTQDVYNYVEVASGTDVRCWIGQDSGGLWWYLNEACP